MRVWLHEAVGNETGWNAWNLDLLGFATWAPTGREVLERVPAKADEHLKWLDRHGITRPKCPPGLKIVEQISGDEVLFEADRAPVTDGQIDRTIRLLRASRGELVRTLESLPGGALDWDPPYRAFASWATWRSIRAVCAHIANTETHYYLPSIGYPPRIPPAPADGDWRRFLPRHRQETTARLEDLRASSDRTRLRIEQEEQWSAAKVLRRLVRHELLHWKSICRIAGQYGAEMRT